MNQILENKSINLDKINKKETLYSPKILSLKFLFWISIFLTIFFIIFYFFLRYNSLKKEQISKSLINNFGITTLYNTNNNYLTSRTSSVVQENSPFVIGLINIDKINLTYPILSNTNEELLKIAPCYFYGPMPNEIGNLCIAGHNNANNTIFGRLYLLDYGDIISIYDLNGRKLDYTIYEKSEVEANDTTCISQDTNNSRIVTLITCNTLKGTRVIIKAKENR